MFKISRFCRGAVAAGIAAAGLVIAAPASAVSVSATELTPITALNGIFPDDGSYLPQNLLSGGGPFTTYFSFSIVAPAARTLATVNWASAGGGSITGFSAAIYGSAGCSGGNCDKGALVGSSIPDGDFGLVIGWLPTLPGNYLLEVSGTGVGNGGRYSGQVTSAVPAPAALGLLGIGLVGLGLNGRRRLVRS